MSSILNTALRTLFLISCLMLCLPAQTQEWPQRYRFGDQITAFMNQLHIEPAELQELNRDGGNDSLQNKEQLKKMPFYKQLQDFLQQHQATYLQIRQYEFDKLLPPPPQLEPLLKKAPSGNNSWTLLLEDPDLLQLICLHTLTPAAMAASVSIQVLPFLPEDAATMEPQLRGLTGHLVYGREYRKDHWQLWYVSRGLCMAFYINLATMQLSDLSYIPLKQLQEASVHFSPAIKPKDAIDSLWLDESSYRWILESSAADSPDESGVHAVQQKMVLFYTRNAARYTACRRWLLSRFLPPVKDETAYRQLADSSLLADIITYRSYPAIAAIDATDITSQLSIPIVIRIHPDEKPDYAALAMESMAGFLHKAEKTADPDTWKIQATGKKKRIEYRWNIKTGSIMILNYYERP